MFVDLFYEDCPISSPPPRIAASSSRRHRSRARFPAPIGRHQLAQASTAPLRDLAVLLGRPVVQTTELGALHLQGDLTCQHQALVRGERARVPAQPFEIVTDERHSLGLRARVHHIDRALLAGERDCALERGLHRAASSQGPPSVVNSRQEALLDHVGDVRAAGKAPSATSLDDELERGLAEAVLQVLASQPVSMNPQQQIATGAGHQRHRGRRILARRGPPRSPGLESSACCFAPASGRHTRMSSKGALTPPSQSPTRAHR